MKIRDLIRDLENKMATMPEAEVILFDKSRESEIPSAFSISEGRAPNPDYPYRGDGFEITFGDNEVVFEF